MQKIRASFKKIQSVAAAYWQPAVLYGLLVIFFGALLWFRLGTLVGGYSAEEQAALEASNNIRNILDNPVNAPFTILAWLLSFIHFGEQAMYPLRVAASLFGLLTLTTFYWLLRYWHGQRSALFGTILFGSSAWFLHTTRLGTPEILLFLPLALLACGLWMKRAHSRIALFLGVLLSASMLYVPGMVWLLAIGAVWQARTLMRYFARRPVLTALGAVGMGVFLAPLGLAVYKSPALLKTLAGFPPEGWPALGDLVHNLLSIPANLFVRGPLDPVQWLDRLPVLDAFSMVMLALGAYLYARHWRLTRVRLVGVTFIVGVVLITLGGTVSLSILMPFLYLLVAVGIGFMLDRWHAVFPRNTIAQSVGTGLVCVAVIIVCWYGLRHYFVAWPNAPATRQVFTIK